MNFHAVNPSPPWRCGRVDGFRSLRRTPGPMAAAKISHWPPKCLASQMRTPSARGTKSNFFPRGQAMAPAPLRQQEQQEVRKTPFDGFFGTKFDILKPRWLPTPALLRRLDPRPNLPADKAERRSAELRDHWRLTKIRRPDNCLVCPVTHNIVASRRPNDRPAWGTPCRR